MAVDALMCPHCRGALSRDGQRLTCGSRHSFDIAKQGYVTLLRAPLQGAPGDDAAMLAARHEFLSHGHYRPIQDAIAAAVRRHAGSQAGQVVADAGAGSGDYLAAVLDQFPASVGIGVDVSKFAARRLARRHPRMCGVLADVWRQIPLRDGRADAVLSVFAPRNVAETARILGTGGHWIVVTPRPQHLCELTAVPGVVTVEAGKTQRLDSSLGDRFTVAERLAVTYELDMPKASAELLLAMGPTAYHLDSAQRSAILAGLTPRSSDSLAITVAVDLSVFTKT
ncbi:methyltransferase type 11 [Hoyosella sp. YIM 151337]|uniref:putative RNA methyltransferase n=1 Tax=Hoyosella sp. YIM 151337 TaxID=2992742 RepID=UPI002236337F|nr:methyltransferase domain-containing protein [Hoyosella sp. YIM 151337]MCW4355119.1 methyltransferase type 11 [Hoyosella sp. YIM 151337]